MKAKPRETQWAPLYPVDLFLDDLVTIAEVLGEFGPVSIETDRFSDVDLARLADVQDAPPKTLSMSTAAVRPASTETVMRFEFSWNYLTIWIVDDRTALYGALTKVRDLIARRRVRRWREPWVAPALGLSAVLAAGACGAGRMAPGTAFPTVLAITAAVLALFALLPDGARTGKRRLVYLHLYPHTQHVTFWGRQGEALVLNMLVALIFFLLGLLAQGWLSQT